MSVTLDRLSYIEVNSQAVGREYVSASTASSDFKVQTVAQEQGSQIAFFFLLFEMLRLSIANDELEKAFRQEERRFYVMHMENVASNYKEQGKFLLVSNIMGGVFEILSGALPIFGHNTRFGGALFDKCKGWFGLSEMKPLKFYANVAKMLHGAAELGKSSGQVQHMFAEDRRTKDQYKGETRKTDESEDTRRLDEANRKRDEIVRLFLALIQMQAEAARSINNM